MSLSASRAKTNIFSVHIGGKIFLHFPSVQSVLNDHASTTRALDGAAGKYSQIISRYGHKFEQRFHDFNKLELQVDMTCISEQLREVFLT